MKISISIRGSQDDERAPANLRAEKPAFCPRTIKERLEMNYQLFETQSYRNLVAKRLSGAVKIPTITYDGMGRVGTDPRWNIFYSFTKYLNNIFSTLHEKLDLEIINEHALLYTWSGEDPQLKPLLFMAHTDVVPAPDSTSGRWTYPPFSGHFDGEYIWGRGSQDDKSNLIAILSTIDALLQCSVRPARTVLVSVGFDEEGGSDQSYGARCLAERILERYGEDGIELIVDEGIPIIEEHFGTEFVLPATAEKGYMDVEISLETAGGHSSTPPNHTAIGYLAQAVQAIESNLFKSQLTDNNPTTEYLKCVANYSKNMPSSLRKAILNPSSSSSDEILKYLDSSLETRAWVRTSTAVDVIRGGEKSNALPETCFALVNHRIAVEDSVRKLKDYYVDIISPLAKKWNFKLVAFGTNIETPKIPAGVINVAGSSELEPSPVSSHHDVRFKWLTETFQTVFGKDVHVSPVLLTGNTDTKFYWKLSSQIYRMSPCRASLDPKGSNIHTVDERMPVEGMMEMIKFYHEFILLVDQKRR